MEGTRHGGGNSFAPRYSYDAKCHLGDWFDTQLALRGASRRLRIRLPCIRVLGARLRAQYAPAPFLKDEGRRALVKGEADNNRGFLLLKDELFSYFVDFTREIIRVAEAGARASAGSFACMDEFVSTRPCNLAHR